MTRECLAPSLLLTNPVSIIVDFDANNGFDW